MQGWMIPGFILNFGVGAFCGMSRTELRAAVSCVPEDISVRGARGHSTLEVASRMSIGRIKADFINTIPAPRGWYLLPAPSHNRCGVGYQGGSPTAEKTAVPRPAPLDIQKKKLMNTKTSRIPHQESLSHPENSEDKPEESIILDCLGFFVIHLVYFPRSKY